MTPQKHRNDSISATIEHRGDENYIDIWHPFPRKAIEAIGTETRVTESDLNCITSKYVILKRKVPGYTYWKITHLPNELYQPSLILGGGETIGVTNTGMVLASSGG